MNNIKNKINDEFDIEFKKIQKSRVLFDFMLNNKCDMLNINMKNFTENKEKNINSANFEICVKKDEKIMSSIVNKKKKIKKYKKELIRTKKSNKFCFEINYSWAEYILYLHDVNNQENIYYDIIINDSRQEKKNIYVNIILEENDKDVNEKCVNKNGINDYIITDIQNNYMKLQILKSIYNNKNITEIIEKNCKYIKELEKLIKNR